MKPMPTFQKLFRFHLMDLQRRFPEKGLSELENTARKLTRQELWEAKENHEPDRVRAQLLRSARVTPYGPGVTR